MQILRIIAFPVSLIYAMVVYLRNILYDHGILSSMAFKTPIICVGNLSVGGTGKTPMIELLLAILQDKQIAVLSRGYKRKTKGFILIANTSDAEEVGDEPLQIFTKFPMVQVAVDEDRQRGISIIEKKIAPELILLDDAFQHRKVRADFSILLSSYDDLYTDDWYLPTGNLRDSKNQAKRADIIVITKCPEQLRESEQQVIVKKIKPRADQQVLFSTLVYEDVLKGAASGTSLAGLKQKQITLITGIAKPQPLIDHLNKTGLEFEHHAFKDHHFLTATELARFANKPFLLTTEKDYMRTKDRLSTLSYIEVRHKFLGAGLEILEQRLRELLGS